MDPDVITILKGIDAGVMDDHRMMDLFIGRDEDDRPYFAYVAVVPSKYLEYRTRLENGEEIDLEDYGDILYEGTTPLPPTDLQNKMAAMGFRHNFENEVQNALCETN